MKLSTQCAASKEFIAELENNPALRCELERRIWTRFKEKLAALWGCAPEEIENAKLFERPE